MFRRFFKDSFVYGATSVLSRGLPILLLPFYTRVFSTSDYGALELLTIFAALVNVTVAFEIAQGLGRYFADTESAGERRAYASTALWFTIGAYTVFSAIVYVASGVVADAVLEHRSQAPVVESAVLATWGTALFYLAQHQLRWRLEPKRYAVVTAVFALVSVVATLAFVLAADLGVRGVFFGQLLGGLAGAGVGLYLARADYGLVFDRDKWKEMIRYSLPLVPSSLGVFVAYYVDRLAIRKFMTVADVGIYSAGFRIASMVGLLVVAAQSALTPLVLAHYRLEETPAELARIFRYFVFVALAVFVSLSLFAHELVAVATAPDYYSASDVVPLLTPAILLSGMYVFAPGLFIAKKTKAFAGINLAAAAANTFLCIALIPVAGIQGAAIATLASAAATFAAYMLASQRLYPAPHAWRRLAAAVIVAAVVVGVHRTLVDMGEIEVRTVPAVLLASALAAIAIGLVGWLLIGHREVAALARRARVAVVSQAR